MKFLHKRHRSKPSVIKRNPAKLNHFHRKANRIKRRLSPFKSKLTSSPPEKSNKYSNNQSVNEMDSHLSPYKNISEQSNSSLPKKNWWTPVWSGLIIDADGKHHKAIRQAIWLYLFLLTAANRRTGILYRKLSTITQETGFHRRSVERWLHTLRDKGYIETHSTGRALQISISKWKTILTKTATRKPD